MLRTSWILALVLTASPVRAAVPRALSLVDAVRLAFSVDPTVAEAHIAVDRGKLGVLRAQLDRVSVKADGQLRELYIASNILGPTIPDTFACTVGTQMFPVTNPSECTSLPGGTVGPRMASDQIPTQTQGLFNLTLNATVPLFSGFRVEANVKRAQRQEDLAATSVHQTRKDIAITVARAYWAVRRLGLMREVTLRALERIKEAELITDGRVRAGLSPPADFNRARLRRLQEEAQLADLVGQENESAAQIGVALGIGPSVALTDPVNFPEAAPPDVEQLLADARKGRPEEQTAKLQLQLQEQVVRMAESAYYPQVAAFGSLQYGNNPFQFGTGASAVSSAANPFSNLSGTLTLGINLSMNFFDTLNTYTSVKDARYELSRLGEERRRVDRVVESDVRVAHAHLLRLYQRRVPLVAARDVARDTLAIMQGRYQNGEALVIEYLDAQIDLVNAELTLADLDGQIVQSWLELSAALGDVVGMAGV